MRAENISKRFGTLKVLNDINLTIEDKQILGIIGPNGAGKTTLINVLTGLVPADKGRIFFKNVDITRLRPHQRFKLGIGRTFQGVKLFLNLTVRENISVAAKMRGEDRTKVSDILGLLKLEDYSDTIVANCNLFVRKKVELAKAIVGKSHIVFLDEPFAGLAEHEILDLIEIIRYLNERGLTFVIIEHNVPALIKLVDKIIAMHLGTIIAEGVPTEVLSNEQVLKVYMG